MGFPAFPRHILCLRLPILAVAFALLGTAAFAGKNCALCNRAIQGQYAVYKHPGGRSFDVCRTCANSAPKCALCGVPYRAGSSSAPLCPDCRRTAHTCDVCERLITTSYREFRLAPGVTHRVCEACERTAGKCAGCGVPHKATSLKAFPNGQSWCASCLAKSRVCESCRNPIAGTYYSLHFQEGAWCGACFHRYEKCHFCGRPMDTISANLPEGRKICRTCFATGLRGETRARAIAATITPTLEGILGRGLPPVPIRIVDANELSATFASGHKLDGAEENSSIEDGHLTELGLFYNGGKKREILLLDFLPEDMAWETLAHEMAHAWQAEYYPGCEDWTVVEGFAQWVADKVCDQHGRRSGLQKLRERRDGYGRAYRIMAAIEARDGVAGVLETMRLGRIPGEFRAIE